MPFKQHPDGITIQLRINPGARKETCLGIVDIADNRKAIKISTQAPPEDGRANKAILQFLAKELGITKKDICLLSGEKTRDKVILVRNTDLSRLETWAHKNA